MCVCVCICVCACMFEYIYIYIYINLVTLVEGDPKVLFSIASIPWCKEGLYKFPRIAPLYP